MKLKNLKIYLLAVFSIFLFNLNTQAIDININDMLIPNRVYNNDTNDNNKRFLLATAKTYLTNLLNQNIQTLQRTLDTTNEKIQILQRTLNETNENIQDLQRIFNETNENIQALQRTLNTTNEDIRVLQEILNRANRNMHTLLRQFGTTLEKIDNMLAKPETATIHYPGSPTITVANNGMPIVTQQIVFSINESPEGITHINENQLFINFTSTPITNLHRIDISNLNNEQDRANIFNNFFGDINVCSWKKKINTVLLPILNKYQTINQNTNYKTFMNMINDDNINIDYVKQIIEPNNTKHIYIMLSMEQNEQNSRNQCHLFEFYCNV